MRLLALGPLRVLDGDEVRNPSTGIHRTILALLLVRLGRTVSVDELLEAVWGDEQPSSGAKTLRAHVSRLRDALAPNRDGRTDDLIETVASGYTLRVERGDVDVCQFEDRAAHGAAALAIGDFEEAREQLGSALALWRGSAFEDVRYEEFAQGEIARLEELRLASLEHRIAADLELGNHHDVVGELRQLTIDDPLREAFWEQLMVALHRSDRQADALAAYRDARMVLADEAGIEPGPALIRLERRIAARDLSLGAAATDPDHATAGALPIRLASFVGRESEVDEVHRLLGDHRLVTLTGPGGIGKTSLAVEVARDVQADFIDGARLVELVRVSEADLVADALAVALDAPLDASVLTLAAITAHLRFRSMLLVFDNCEHVLDESAAVVERVLTTCPEVRVLATSRHPLGLNGEQSWSVPSLALPVGLRAQWDAPAVRLFRERAEAATSQFCADDAAVGDVVELCRRLDGNPLAIELAAARVRMMSVAELLGRLGDHANLLSDSSPNRPARHRTLATTLAWSYSLLTEDERIAFQRLSVFEGGFSIDAAESVVAGRPIGPDAVVDLVGRLIDWSLVHTDGVGGESRYSLLETVRAFAADRLAESGDDGAPARHLAHFVDMTEGLADYILDADAATVRRVELESANLGRAMGTAIELGHGQPAARLATLLWTHYFVAGRFGPGDRIPASRILRLLGPDPSVERASMLDSQLAGWVADFRDPSTVATLDELERVAEALDDGWWVAVAAWRRAIALESTGNTRGAFDVMHLRAVGSMESTNPGRGFMLVELAYCATLVGEFVVAEDAMTAAEGTLQGDDERAFVAKIASDRGNLAWYRGDLSTARRHLHAALGAARRIGFHGIDDDVLHCLAGVALAAGDLDLASSWARQLRELQRVSVGLTFQTARAEIIDAHCARRRGDLDEAVRMATRSVEVAVLVDHPAVLVEVTIVLAQLSAALGHDEHSAALHRAAESARRRIGFVHPAHVARELAAERSRLPDAFRPADQTSAELVTSEQVARFLDELLASA